MVIIHIVIIDSDNIIDVVNDSRYYWATAKVRQFVALKKIIMTEVLNNISTRILEGRYIHAIYMALTKPSADSTNLEDCYGSTKSFGKENDTTFWGIIQSYSTTDNVTLMVGNRNKPHMCQRIRARPITSKGIADLGKTRVRIYEASTGVDSLSYSDGWCI